MGQFIIHGGKSLGGEISVGGSKNAALPIIFSCIMLHGASVIENLPDISDVDVALDILRGFGATVVKEGERVVIDTENLEYNTPGEELVSKIRASSYLIGATLSRFGVAKIQRFGGCNFDNRPIDMHLMAAEKLGAKIEEDTVKATRLTGNDIYFDKISVGATVNAILLTATAMGKSRIFGYAKEPHIISLVNFLNSAGSKIKITDECIEVYGKELHTSSADIIPDMIEAGTYLALSLMTDSKIKVVGADRVELKSFITPLLSAGVSAQYHGNAITLSGPLEKELDIITSPYPGFPTDLQPQMAPLLAASCGGKITEKVWINRFGYLAELKKFGVEYDLGDGFAIIKKSKIHSANATVPDLRGGAALIMAAVFSDGESVIGNAELIKRGYGNIVGKLRSIGVEIEEF